MTSLHQMLANFSQWLYTMWLVNILVGIYACYVIYQYGTFLKDHMSKFWDQKQVTWRILQAFSGIIVVVMFLWADMWAMSYYTVHTLGPLEFFFYAFDAAVLRHLSEEANRFHNFTK